jgi:hypothetical protein
MQGDRARSKTAPSAGDRHQHGKARTFVRPVESGSTRDRWAAGLVARAIHRAGRAAASRKPRLSFLFYGVFLWRFADLRRKEERSTGPPIIVAAAAKQKDAARRISAGNAAA